MPDLFVRACIGCYLLVEGNVVLARVDGVINGAWAWQLQVERGCLGVHALLCSGAMKCGRSVKRQREAGHRNGRVNGLPDALVTRQHVRCRRRFCSSVEDSTELSSLS